MPARARRRTAGAVLIALAAHVLLLLALLIGARVYRAPEPLRALQLQIMAVVREQPRPAPPRVTAPSAPRARPPLLEPSPAAPPLSAPRGPEPAAPVEDPPAVGDVAAAQHLRDALRGLTACGGGGDTANLAPELRRRCDDRAARLARADGSIAAPGAGAFAPAPPLEPMWVRKPHNGCLPRLADRARPLASQGGRSSATTTAGVGCAWSF